MEWLGPEPDRSESLMFIFDGGVLSDPSGIRLPSDELVSFWFVDPGTGAPGVAYCQRKKRADRAVAMMRMALSTATSRRRLAQGASNHSPRMSLTT
jgi:hypothetical protein